MKTLSILAPLTIALALSNAACDKKSSAPEAQVTAAQPAAAVAPTLAGAQSYAISSDTSKVEWQGAKITGKHDGSFKKFSGKVELPASGKIEEGKVTIDVDASSLSSDPEKLVQHLKSPDFFDVAKYPSVTFTSTSLKAGGDNGATHTVTGNLSLHGVTKSITFPAKISVAGDTVNANAEFQINRKDFGIVYPGKPDDLIKDEVVVKLDVHAKKSG